MKIIFAVILITFSTGTLAETAKWTGEFEYLGEDKNTTLWGCTYKDMNGKQYQKVMELFCNPEITLKDTSLQGSKGNNA